VSDAIAKRDRDLGNFIPGPSLDSYRARFAGHFALDRRDGVLTVRAHRDGQAALWSRGLLIAKLRDSYAHQFLAMTARPGEDSRIPDRRE
jgi:hypothetical protein